MLSAGRADLPAVRARLQRTAVCLLHCVPFAFLAVPGRALLTLRTSNFSCPPLPPPPFPPPPGCPRKSHHTTKHARTDSVVHFLVPSAHGRPLLFETRARRPCPPLARQLPAAKQPGADGDGGDLAPGAGAAVGPLPPLAIGGGVPGGGPAAALPTGLGTGLAALLSSGGALGSALAAGGGLRLGGGLGLGMSGGLGISAPRGLSPGLPEGSSALPPQQQQALAADEAKADGA